jgi:Putative adhesin
VKIGYGMARCRRLLLAVGAVGIMAVAGCTVNTGSPSSPPPAGSTTQPAGATYNLPAGVKILTVNNQAGTTQVTATSGAGQIHVVQRPAGKPTAYRKTAGSAATIGANCPDGIHFGDCHMDYQIQLPPGTALTVAADAGHVILHGSLTKAQVTTHAGQVSGTGLGRGSFTVATQVGEVDLAFASAPARVKVTTTTGAINVTVPGGTSYKVTTSATVGDKDVTVPSDASAANIIDLHAEVGHISLHQG